MHIRLDPAAGVAELGGTVLPLALVGQEGAVQLNGPEGPTIRPLTFGERSRLLQHALAARHPLPATGRLIADASLVQPGQAGPLIVEIMAMVLAGAQETEAPSLTETAVLVARHTGWTPIQLATALATDIDRLALQLQQAQAGDGWTRILLTSGSEDVLESLHDQLAGNLLQRASGGLGREMEQVESSHTSLESPATPDKAYPPASTEPAAPDGQNGSQFDLPQMPGSPPAPDLHRDSPPHRPAAIEPQTGTDHGWQWRNGRLTPANKATPPARGSLSKPLSRAASRPTLPPAKNGHASTPGAAPQASHPPQAVGRPPAGQAMDELNPFGVNPSGMNPSGMNPIGMNPSGKHPFEHRPPGQDAGQFLPPATGNASRSPEQGALLPPPSPPAAAVAHQPQSEKRSKAGTGEEPHLAAGPGSPSLMAGMPGFEAVAAELAASLHAEADLRGIDR